MHNKSWMTQSRVAYALFWLASIVYICGISPTIYWRDSPEFVVAVHILGTTHPAGAPTYTLLAKLLTFLPFGTVAFRVNLFSSLCGALTVSLSFLVLYELLSAATRQLRFIAAISGAVFLLFSESLWLFSGVAEVYTLQDSLLVGLLYILLKARTQQNFSSTLLIWLFAFLYGLSAGVHATMALFVPAFLLLLLMIDWKIFLRREGAFVCFFFLLGMTVFLYLPIRSLSEPALDWGDTETLRQFLIHITDRKDADFHFELPWLKLPNQIKIYLGNLINEFTLFGIFLGVIGFAGLFFHDKVTWLAFFLIFLGNVGFLVRAWTSAFGFLPSFIMYSLWIGYGIYCSLNFIYSLYHNYSIRIPQIIIRTTLYGCIVLVWLQSFLNHAEVAYKSEDYSAELYGKELMAQLPPDAIFFSEYSWFPLLYLQQVERQRPDFTLLLQSEIFAPSQFAFPSQERFPYITLVTSEKPVGMSTLEYFWKLCQLNQDKHQLFWDPDNTIRALFSKHLRPLGLLFAFSPSHEIPLTSQLIEEHRQLLADAVTRILHKTNDREARDFLGGKINQIGLFFRTNHFDDYAAEMYVLGLRLQPERFDLRNNYGGVLLVQGRLAEAFDQFQVAYERDPGSFIINKNLGLLFLRGGDDGRAITFLERALQWGTPDEGLFALLGEAYLRLEKVSAAIAAYQAALTIAGSQSIQQQNLLLQGDVYAQLGEAYIRLGQFTEARQALQTAATLYARELSPENVPPSLQTVIHWLHSTLQTLDQGATSELNPHPFLTSTALALKTRQLRIR